MNPYSFYYCVNGLTDAIITSHNLMMIRSNDHYLERAEMKKGLVFLHYPRLAIGRVITCMHLGLIHLTNHRHEIKSDSVRFP